jgi:hypothetical protein
MYRLKTVLIFHEKYEKQVENFTGNMPNSSKSPTMMRFKKIIMEA